MHFRSCRLIPDSLFSFSSFPSAGCSYKLEIGLWWNARLEILLHFLLTLSRSEQSAFGALLIILLFRKYVSKETPLYFRGCSFLKTNISSLLSYLFLCIFAVLISFLTCYFRILIFTLSLLFGSDLKNNFLRLTCLIILWRLNASRKWSWQFIFGYSFIKYWPFCRDFQNDFPFGNLSAYRKLCFLVVCFLCVMHIPVCQ